MQREGVVDQGAAGEEHALAKLYRDFVQQRFHSEASDSDRALQLFKGRLLDALRREGFASYSFDTVDPHYPITVVKSESLTIVSWDELNGGTWHLYNSAFRYRNNGALHSGMFSLENTNELTFTDTRNFKIQKLENDRYLVTGYGTHGHGHDFYSLRLVHFDGEKMVDCNACFDGNNRLVFYKPRGLKVVPEYNEKNKTIRYPELQPALKEGEDTGFLKPTGKFITLLFTAGSFVRQ